MSRGSPTGKTAPPSATLRLAITSMQCGISVPPISMNREPPGRALRRDTTLAPHVAGRRTLMKAMALIGIGLLLSGCDTMNGLGMDMQRAGANLSSRATASQYDSYQQARSGDQYYSRDEVLGYPQERPSDYPQGYVFSPPVTRPY